MRVPGLKRLIGTIRRRRRLAIAVAVPLAAAILAGAGWIFLAGRDRTPLESEARLLEASMRPAPRPTGIVDFADGCVTAECHASLLVAPAVHAPVATEACDACHGADQGGHTYPLVSSRAELCRDCHDVGGTGLVRHRALGNDGCLGCHDPHGSATGPLLLNANVERTCSTCHPASEGMVRHQPYAAGECHACHEVHDADTPGLLRGGEVDFHCASCHAPLVHRMNAMGRSHCAVEGSCLACHGAHATDVDGLLIAEPRNGCVRCHPQVAGVVEGSTVSHDAVIAGRQCVSCHDPHGSDNPMMLRDDQASVCLSCHDQPQVAADGRQIPGMATIADAGVVHGPVQAGECAACHSVHGSSHARLLRQVNPEALAGEFDARNYALCFACHDRALVLDQVGAATQFRDGDRNLHRVHVLEGGSARGCGSCHAVHSSTLPRLIAEAVAYQGSDWNMPMGFEISENGGSCAPGCHEPLRYRRNGGSEGGTP